LGPNKISLNLKDLSPRLQIQVKKAVDRLLRNRLSQNLSDLRLLSKKQFSSKNKPLINFRLDLSDRFHRKLTVKSSNRNPFIALKSALSKAKAFLRTSKEEHLAKIKRKR
jgi:hypothetical protein